MTTATTRSDASGPLRLTPERAPAQVAGLQALPRLRVRLAGNEIAAEEVTALAAVAVHHALGQPAVCELTWHEPRGPLARADARLHDQPLQLTLAGVDVPLFEGHVTTVEHVFGAEQAHTLHLRGADALEHLRRRQPVRAHAQVTPASLARELVADLGLDVAAVESGPLHAQLAQPGEDDLALLRRFAASAGLYLTLRDGTLHLLTLAGLGAPQRLQLGHTLFEARLTCAAPAPTAIDASAWDPRQAQARRGHADEARRPTPGEGATGGASAIVDAAPPVRLLPDLPAFDDDATQAAAQAQLDRDTAAARSLWGLAEGDVRLRPGTCVEVSGAPALQGRYTLAAVTHTIDAQAGFISEIESQLPTPPVTTRAAWTTLGIVTRVDDPDGLGRVRVQLPACADIESVWLEVLLPAAGRDKGFVALPDVDDRVLVLFSHGDLARGVVLGALFGDQAPPDAGIAEGRVRRFLLRSPSGHSLCLDDARQELRVQDARGSRLEFTPDTLRLHAKTDLVIEAPGRRLRVCAQQIDFERA
jgi:uncharacterized protein involved in type VI secretion and phage assembly